MGFFNKNSTEEAASRLIEEKLYDIVAKELEAGIKRSGLWVKAMSKSNGDEAKAMSLYIEYRIQSIIDEEELKRVAKIEELEKQKRVEEQRREIAIKRADDIRRGGVPEDIQSKIMSDGYSFLSKVIVRKNGTFDDYKIVVDDVKIYLQKDNQVFAEYIL